MGTRSSARSSSQRCTSSLACVRWLLSFAEAPDQAIPLHRGRVPANPALEPALSVGYGMGRFPYRVIIHAGCTLNALACAGETQHGPDAWSTKSHSGLLLFCYNDVARYLEALPCTSRSQGGASLLKVHSIRRS